MLYLDKLLSQLAYPLGLSIVLGALALALIIAGWRRSGLFVLAIFRAAGIDAEPAPTDFEVMPEPAHLMRWLPDAEALSDSTRALKEYVGWWVYRWRGWAES